MKTIVCKVGKEEFALDIEHVISIERIQPLTEIPDSPYFVSGMMRFRGRIILIVDLKKWLSQADTQANSEQEKRIIIVENDGVIIGVVVDVATEILDIEEGSLQEVTEVSNEKADQILNLESRIILLLNIPILISKITN